MPLSFPGDARPRQPAGESPWDLPARGGGVSDVLIIHIFAERTRRRGRRCHISHVHSRTHMYTRSPRPALTRRSMRVRIALPTPRGG